MIRDAVGGDAAAIARLLGELGYPPSAEGVADLVARYLAADRSRVQVAEFEGEVVGLVATHAVLRLDADGVTCRITDIVVAERVRGRGIGSALMRAAEEEARRAGAPRLDLSSGDWRNDAHRFYARHGFETRARSFTKRLP